MFISSYENLRNDIFSSSAIETSCHLGTKTEFDVANKTAQGFVSFAIRKDSVNQRSSSTIGTWFRLVRPEGVDKRIAFEQALARVRAGEADAAVFRYRQIDFDAIPGSPWVYWITPGLRQLFMELPKLGEITPIHLGMTTSDNSRFLRFWWEVGSDRIGFGFEESNQAKLSGKKWFPYMKGGSFRRWYGNQEHVINWMDEGTEIQEAPSFPRAKKQYFRRGVTYSFLTSARFNARLSPGGFIFDVAGSSLFPEDVSLVLAVMNCSFAAYALKLINPTVNFQVGDIARLPIPTQFSKQLENLVDRAISMAMQDSAEDETTFDFIAPPWSVSLDDTLTDIWLRQDALKDVEQAIDEEVYRLYDISDEDRKAIESELAEPAAEGEEAKEGEQDYIDDEELALRWISYAVGIVMGRFQPGVSGALGQGRFSSKVAEQLRALADADGVATLDEGHQDDLARKVLGALEIMLGEAGASEVLETALEEGNPETLLRRYLAKDFFKRHLQQYRKRPVYWLLESPERSYSVYVFHERATRDILPLIMGSRYVAGKINYLQNRMDGIQEEMKSSEGKKRRDLEKSLERSEKMVLDVEAFEVAIKRVLEQKNERGETVGWAPEIDDGVILNLAPIRGLMPSWKEPEKFWQELEEGKYDWSHTAMRYWPDRVRGKCKANKSYAIAHNRLDVYEGGK
jgi:hypothetical protein